MSRHFIVSVFVGVVVSAWAVGARAGQLVTNLTDADTIYSFDSSNENIASSMETGDFGNQFPYVGLIKFGLSSIPDDATITSMSLQLYTQLVLTTTAGIYYDANDSWSSTTNDPYPTLGPQVGASQVINAQFSPFNWDLDINAFDWTADLTDNVLSLVIATPLNVVWFGLTDIQSQQPEWPLLTVNYDVPVNYDNPGDENEDLVVNLTDLNDVKNNFGNSGAVSPDGNGIEGDENEDGLVNLDDLNDVKNYFGNDYSSGPVAGVPEPATLSMFAVLGGLAVVRRRAVSAS
jgi:hypothetical protein